MRKYLGSTPFSCLLRHFFFWGWVAMSTWGCNATREGKSLLFYEIFRNDTTTFRGVELGDPMDGIKQLETNSLPVHEDQMGLSYQITLSPGYEMWVDYHADNLISPAPQNKLAAIDVNIFVGDEVETAKLFREVGQFYDESYGIHRVDGGDYVWEGASKYQTAMEITLRLNENKVSLTLNYIDIEPDRQLKSLGDYIFDSLKQVAVPPN